MSSAKKTRQDDKVSSDPGSGDKDGGAEAADRPAMSGPAMGFDRPSGGAKRSRARLPIIAILCAATAAVVSWMAGESRLFAARAQQVRFMAAGRQIEWSTPETKAAAQRATLARLQGIFGLLLASGLGAAGASSRSAWAALAAGLAGAGLGALFGAVTPYLVLPAYEHYLQVHGGDVPASMIMHASLWGGIGAAAGLALGLGLGGRWRPWQAALGGLLGAALGAVLFDLVGALVLPLDETGLPDSATARARLVARLVVALAVALVATLTAGQTPIRAGTTDRR
jgi:hypothetical protein